ncbi:hypothetical protein M422DRAFT_25996 [Sphaerobolus stellatus SS14]|nr:hypothetical protein M422DRAFT_25996 [Sphaerobolus stellatus SS14]
MAPWQSLAARQGLDPTLVTSVTPLPTISSSSLVFDQNHTSSTISGIKPPTITETSIPSATPTTTSTPSPSPSSKDDGLSLPLTAIIGLAVGSFVLLATLLILFMCLRNRKSKSKSDSESKSKSRPKRDKSWKRMEQREREKSFGNMFTPLRVSLPDVALTNPFGASPVSPKILEENPRDSQFEESHTGPIYLGSAGAFYTPEVKSIDMEERKRHVSLSTPTLLSASNYFDGPSNPFIFASDSPRKSGKLRPPLKAQERESTLSDFVDLNLDDYDSSTRPSYDSNNTPTVLQFPIPSPRQSNFHLPPQPANFSSSTELKPPPLAVLRDQRNQHVTGRPSFQALITALEAPPSAEPPPLSAVSHETGITAIGTPRSSWRTSGHRPPGLNITPMDETHVLFSTDRPTTPKTPRGTPLILRRVSKVDIDPRSTSTGDAFERNTDSPIPFPSRSASRAPSRSTTPTPIAIKPAPVSSSGYQAEESNNRGEREYASAIPTMLQPRSVHSRNRSTIGSASVYSLSSVYSNDSDETIKLPTRR